MTKLLTIARCLLLASITVPPFWAQVFASGSDGSDGKLDYTGQTGTINFDPSTIPNHPAGSNVFNFTTITIPNSLTVRFSQSVLNGPVIWLAQGTVSIGIGATLDLNGSNGGPPFPTVLRALSIPGAGGYPGGAGALGSNKATAGLGPGTGGGAPCSPGVVAKGGSYTGNQFAIPLIGGSGGGGCGGGGGAGAGAILISSSVSISNSGRILAVGGQAASCGDSGSGSGGAVRLVAPSLSAGYINTQPGCYGLGASRGEGTYGVVRLESFNNPGSNIDSAVITYGSPFNTFVTASIVPTIKVVSVNGVSIAQPATGSFQMPDVSINTATSVLLKIEATQVPIGTIVNLIFFSDNGPDFGTSTTGVAGTLALSTATASVTFPAGFTRGFVSASF